MMPPGDNEKSRQQWQQLAESVPFDPRAEWSKR